MVFPGFSFPSAMLVKQITLNHFGVNCYIIWDEATKECAIVDPAAETTYEDAQVTQFIDGNKLNVKWILLTHAHVDHIAGLRECCHKYNLSVTMHEEGFKLLRQAAAYGSVMGFEVESMDDLPTNYINDGDMLPLGGSKIEARYVPGHCPGSLCYVLADEKLVLTGDALFRLSIGRADLPGGNERLLVEKLKSRIMVLDDDYQVLPGHGELSTIGDERKYNPFF